MTMMMMMMMMMMMIARCVFCGAFSNTSHYINNPCNNDADCSANCDRCAVNGVDKCDYGHCDARYALDPASKTCLGEKLFRLFTSRFVYVYPTLNISTRLCTRRFFSKRLPRSRLLCQPLLFAVGCNLHVLIGHILCWNDTNNSCIINQAVSFEWMMFT